MAKEFEIKNGVIIGKSDSEAKAGKLEFSEARGGVFLHYDEEHKNLIGRETQAKCENITGSTIPIASVVRVNGFNNTFTVEPAIANTIEHAHTTFGVTCCEMSDTDIGFVYKYGSIGGLDTSSFNVGDYIYLSDKNAGEFTNIKPIAPNYIVQIGIVAISHVSEGVIGIEVVPFTGTDTSVNSKGLLDGIITPTQKVEFINDGTDVYAEISNQDYPSEDLPLILNDVRYLLNTTTNIGTNGKARVKLVNGLPNSKPQDNWLYLELNGNTPEFKSSTTFPSGDYAWVGLCTLKTIAETIADDVFSFQRTNNAVSISDGEGIIDAITKRIRRMGSTYISGVEPTITIDDTQAPDSVKISTSSGVVTQFREQNFDALDGESYYIVNHPTEPYKKISNLNEIDVLANGDPIDDNRRIGFNIFGMQCSSGIPDRQLITLPLDDYGNNNSAIYDYNNFAVTTIPSDVGSRYIVFRICRVVFRYDSNGGEQWTNLLGDGGFQDERGFLMGTGSGGAGSNSRTDFDDATFYWYNISDPTKILNMNLANISTSNTRTISMVDDDLDLAKYPTKYIEIENDGNVVLNTVEKYNKYYSHVTDISGFNLTDNNDGSVDISSGVVVFEHNNVMKSYNVSNITATLTDETTNFIYVDYNTNSPIVSYSDTLPSLTDRTKHIIYSISRFGNEITFVDLRNMGVNYAEKALNSDISVNGLKHDSGCRIGENGTRNISISSGSFYIGNKNILSSSFDSNVSDTFITTYRDGSSGWTYISGETQIDNSNYDDGIGTLSTLSNNRYGVHWVYSMIDSIGNDKILIQYGQGDYKLDEAYDSSIPSEIPNSVINFSNVVLIGRIIIGKNLNAFEDIQSAFENTFTKSGSSNHAEMSNLDFANSGHTGFVSVDDLDDYLSKANGGTVTGILNQGGESWLDSDTATFLRVQKGAGTSRITTRGGFNFLNETGQYLLRGTDGEIQAYEKVIGVDATASTHLATLGQINTLLDSKADTTDLTAYLKRDGSLAMTGALNMGNQNLTNGGSASFTTSINNETNIDIVGTGVQNNTNINLRKDGDAGVRLNYNSPSSFFSIDTVGATGGLIGTLHKFYTSGVVELGGNLDLNNNDIVDGGSASFGGEVDTNSLEVIDTASLVAGRFRFYQASASGSTITTKTGTVSDFKLRAPNGDEILLVPTGTKNIELKGNLDLNGNDIVDGGSATFTDFVYVDKLRLFSNGGYLNSALSNTSTIQSSTYNNLTIVGTDLSLRNPANLNAKYFEVSNGNLTTSGSITAGGNLDLNNNDIVDGGSAMFNNTLYINKTGDRAKLQQFGTERPWYFEQIGAGANTNFALTTSNNDKGFYIIQSTDDLMYTEFKNGVIKSSHGASLEGNLDLNGNDIVDGGSASFDELLIAHTRTTQYNKVANMLSNSLTSGDFLQFTLGKELGVKNAFEINFGYDNHQSNDNFVTFGFYSVAENIKMYADRSVDLGGNLSVAGSITAGGNLDLNNNDIVDGGSASFKDLSLNGNYFDFRTQLGTDFPTVMYINGGDIETNHFIASYPSTAVPQANELSFKNNVDGGEITLYTRGGGASAERVNINSARLSLSVNLDLNGNDIVDGGDIDADNITVRSGGNVGGAGGFVDFGANDGALKMAEIKGSLKGNADGSDRGHLDFWTRDNSDGGLYHAMRITDTQNVDMFGGLSVSGNISQNGSTLDNTYAPIAKSIPKSTATNGDAIRFLTVKIKADKITQFISAVGESSAVANVGFTHDNTQGAFWSGLHNVSFSLGAEIGSATNRWHTKLSWDDPDASAGLYFRTKITNAQTTSGGAKSTYYTSGFVTQDMYNFGSDSEVEFQFAQSVDNTSWTTDDISPMFKMLDDRGVDYTLDYTQSVVVGGTWSSTP